MSKKHPSKTSNPPSPTAAPAADQIHTMTIRYNATRDEITVTGPLNNKSFCFKMLEMAEANIAAFRKPEGAIAPGLPV